MTTKPADDKILKMIYSLNNIPLEFIGQKLEDYIPPTKLTSIKKKLTNMPTSGRLLINGTAGPVINLLSPDKKVFGIDFVQYYNCQFTDKDYYVPKNYDIYYIYNVGKEPAKTTTYSSKLLESFMAIHKDAFIIVETSLNKTEFERTYQMSFINQLTIKPKKEEKWL